MEQKYRSYSLNETKCPICGRLFYPTQDHVYKTYVKGKLVRVCRWSCLNRLKEQKDCK